MLLNSLGINAVFRLINRNKSIILLYHGVCDDGFDLLKGYDERYISKSVFRQQLQYLQRKGYSFVSLTELADIINNKGKSGKKVVLTFDDGFRNVIENAYPVMREYYAKGCFYLVSDLIGTSQLLWTDRIETVVRSQKKGPYTFIFKGENITYVLTDRKSYEYAMRDIKAKLRTISNTERLEHLKQFNDITACTILEEFHLSSWEEIKKLDPGVMEIGSHTRTHPNCTSITSDKELEEEIYRSKNDIEANAGRQVRHFCYPAGSYDERVIEKVKTSGYQSGVTIRYGFNDKNTDLFTLKRIEGISSLLQFKAFTSGSYHILYRLGSLKRIKYAIQNTSPNNRRKG